MQQTDFFNFKKLNVFHIIECFLTMTVFFLIKKKRKSINKSYKLIPPVDEEATYEQICGICAKEVEDGKLLFFFLILFISKKKNLQLLL